MNELLAVIAAYRFPVLAGALALATFYSSARQAILFFVSLIRRLRRVPGWAMQRPRLHLGMSVLWLVVTAALGTTILFWFELHLHYQAVSGARKVGTLASAPGAVVFMPGTGYPAQQMRMGVTHRQWAIEGHLFLFTRPLELAGFSDSHRINHLIGRTRPSIPEQIEIEGAFPGETPVFSIFKRIDKYMPMIEARDVRSPFVQAGQGRHTLYVFEGGYTFLSPPAAGGDD